MSLLKKWAFLVFLFCLQSWANAAEQTKIKVQISQEYLDKLSPEQKKVLQDVISALETTVIKSLDNVGIQLPTTRFDTNRGQLIDLASLFKDPNAKTPSSEPESLAIDEKGERLRLTPDQIDQIRNEGLLKVPSKEFPGQYHVWKINTLLQKGRKNIAVSFRKDVGSALGHIILEIPADLVGRSPKSWSIKQGMSNIAEGFRGLISNIVGLVEQGPKYSEAEIQKILVKRKVEFVVSKISTEKHDEPFDPRLFEVDLTKQMAPILSRIRQKHSTDWESKKSSLEKELKANYRKENIAATYEQVRAYVAAQMTSLEFEAYNKALTEDTQLDQMSPGYGKLLSNNRIAVQVAETIEKELATRVEEVKQNIQTKLKETNPVLGTNLEWLDNRVAAESQKFYQSIRWKYLANIPEKLDALGLHQEANIYRKMFEFQKDSESRIHDELAAEKVPAREFQFEKKIWNSDQWIVNEVKDNQGNVTYVGDTYTKSSVKTDQWFWRLQLVGSESAADFKNGIYKIFVTNLWNGPVGLKALFGTQSFCAKKMVDPQTGKIVANPESKTSTYFENLNGITSSIADSCKAFDSKPKDGVLGPKFGRFVNRVATYGWGGLSYAVVGLGQPLLTACNLGISCALGATSVAWAPMSSLFKLGFGILVYDFNSPGLAPSALGHSIHNWFPAAQYCLGDIACAGVGQAALKGAQAVVYEPTAALAVGLYGSVRAGARYAYDSAIASLIARDGRVPVSDNWSATRIHGPGVAKDYFYRIQPALAILALQAMLEKEELSLYRNQQQTLINKPLQDYYGFFASLLLPFADVTMKKSKVQEELESENNVKTKELADKVNARLQQLDNLSKLPVAAHKIKLSNSDLEKTLQFGKKLVASFYEENLKPHLSDRKRSDFWAQARTEEGDFEGLAKYYLSGIFSESFLYPLEESDKDLIIEVKPDNLANIFQHFPEIQ